MSETDFDPYVRAWHVTVTIDGKKVEFKEQSKHWFLTWKEAETEFKEQLEAVKPDYTWETDFNHEQTDTRKVFIGAARDWENPLYIDLFAGPIVNIIIVYKECHPEIMQKVRARTC